MVYSIENKEHACSTMNNMILHLTLPLYMHIINSQTIKGFIKKVQLIPFNNIV